MIFLTNLFFIPEDAVASIRNPLFVVRMDSCFCRYEEEARVFFIPETASAIRNPLLLEELDSLPIAIWIAGMKIRFNWMFSLPRNSILTYFYSKQLSMFVSDRILHFYQSLKLDIPLPEGIEVINPYKNEEVISVCKTFYSKYYSDTKGRRLILGINPGRFGAGITGIPFTDPLRLEKDCNIKNSFDKRPELSSEFIYLLINSMGGPEHFYSHYLIGAVSPLGFIKDKKNFNYYDSKELTRALKPFIIKSLVEQIGCGVNSRKCYCLGQGKNFEYLSMLNAELKLFSEIIPIPHPRWVMQYKRKKLSEIIEQTAKMLSM